MNMKIFIFLFCLLAPFGIKAQEENEVRAVVNSFFAAMYEADSSRLLSLTHKDWKLSTLDSVGQVRNTSNDSFIQSITSAAPGDFKELISQKNISVKDALAIVHTQYQFYYKNKLSHCGENVFILGRIGSTWKILSVTDTREKCIL